MKKNKMLQDSLLLATMYHHGQVRKYSVKGVALPYLVHPVDVMKLLWNWGIANEDMLSAALLHDTAEDGGKSPEIILADIHDNIGEDVASIVEELTFIPPKSGDKSKAKKEYVATFATKSIEAVVIKVADRLSNVKDTLVNDTSYARAYYHKADQLFEVLRFRRAAVIATFGEDTYNAIIQDVDALSKFVIES